MAAFRNLVITEVLPEVSYTIRPADYSYAYDARAKSWCAATATVASVTAPTAAQISPVEADNARLASATSKAVLGDISMPRACTSGASAAYCSKDSDLSRFPGPPRQ